MTFFTILACAVLVYLVVLPIANSVHKEKEIYRRLEDRHD